MIIWDVIFRRGLQRQPANTGRPHGDGLPLLRQLRHLSTGRDHVLQPPGPSLAYTYLWSIYERHKFNHIAPLPFNVAQWLVTKTIDNMSNFYIGFNAHNLQKGKKRQSCQPLTHHIASCDTFSCCYKTCQILPSAYFYQQFSQIPNSPASTVQHINIQIHQYW